METNQGFMLRARRTGYTTWMLKSAINNPDCIIVGANQQHCRHLEKRYYKLLKEESFLKNFGNYNYLIILLILVSLSLAYFYFTIRNWIKLNEAKDVLYICKGIDIDERIDRGKSIRYEESGK